MNGANDVVSGEWHKPESDEETPAARVSMTQPAVYDASVVLRRLMDGQVAAMARDAALMKENRELHTKLETMAEQLQALEEKPSGSLLALCGCDKPPPADGKKEVSPLLLYGCYSVFASMYMLVSLVAPFFPHKADEWGINTKMVGFICACDPLGEVVASFFATYVMGLLGMEQTAVIGMVANGISSVIFGLAPMYTQDPDILVPVFITMRLANGVATTLTYVSIFTLLCALQPDKLGQVTANANVLATIGLIVGPPFGNYFHDLGERNVMGLGDWFGAFGCPFIAASVVLVVPSLILWAAGEQDVEEEEEEEEEVSFTLELQRMASVCNVTLLTGVMAVVTSMVLSNAIYPILGPHLEPASGDVLEGGDAIDRHPFAFTNSQISWTFSSSSVGFLPMSLWIGRDSDSRGEERDFPWMRRTMVAGLMLNMCAYYLMGPAPFLKGIFGDKGMLVFETTAAMVTAQLMLGAANAMTLISAFPFFEGVTVLKGRTTLNQEQTLAIAGTWYNAAYSAGCALGPYLAGLLIAKNDFAETEFYLSFLCIFSALFMIAEATLDNGATGGFFARSAKGEAALTTPLIDDDGGVAGMKLGSVGDDSIYDGQDAEAGGGEEDEDEEDAGGEDEGPGCIPESFYTAKNKIICICALIAAIFVIISAVGVTGCKEVPLQYVPTCPPLKFDANCKLLGEDSATPTASPTLAPSAARHAAASPSSSPTVASGSKATAPTSTKPTPAGHVTRPTKAPSGATVSKSTRSPSVAPTAAHQGRRRLALSSKRTARIRGNATTTFVCCGGSDARNPIDC